MNDTPQEHFAKQRIVYTVPGLERVTVQRDETYRMKDDGAFTMDLYYPSSAATGRRYPAVLFVTGFSDAGAQRMFGRQFKEMGSYVSWAKVVAAAGMVAVTYNNETPEADVHAVLQHLRDHAADLQIDEQRLALWACSGHVPNALSVLLHAAGGLKCAVLCYGYLLDFEGSSLVADAAKQFGFVNPCAGKSVNDLPRNVPLFVARAGHDVMPGLNTVLDHFVERALTSDLPMTLVNYPGAPHAFDLFADADESRDIIRQILTFMSSRLAT
jgi:dienelactone hydrolase